MNKLTDKHQKVVGELRESMMLQQKLETLNKEILRLMEKTAKQTEDLESTLSCLSCLEYLSDPLTLICGHSICRKCFTTHSDPSSQDSLVFCEECKIETKNKVLKE